MTDITHDLLGVELTPIVVGADAPLAINQDELAAVHDLVGVLVTWVVGAKILRGERRPTAPGW